MSRLSKKFVTFRTSPAGPELGYQNDVAWDLCEPPNRPRDYKDGNDDKKQCQDLRQGKNIWQQAWTGFLPGEDLLALVLGSGEPKSLLAQHFQDRVREIILQKALAVGCVLEIQQEQHLGFDVKVNISSSQM